MPARPARNRAIATLAALVVLSACSGAGGGGGGGGDGEGTAAEADGGGGESTSITVAVVNNPQMEDIQSLIGRFNEDHPDITVEFLTLPENQLRDRVTQDIAAEGGQFDAVMIGPYETPIWAENGWLTNLSEYADADEDYQVDDLIPSVATALSYEDNLHAVPFYGESSFLMYRTDLFEEAGLEMPDQPTWDEVAGFARELNDPDNNMAGICLRGLPGWGEMFAPLNTVVNTFGGAWYDTDWNAQLTAPPFVEAVTFYTDLVRDAGVPGSANAGFTECLTAYSQGQAAMWYDATVAAGLLEDESASTVVGQNGYVAAPVRDTEASGWLWTWALAIPETSDSKDAAWEFISWATSQEYIQLAGEELGWERVPPGSRQSTYEIPEYQEAGAAFVDQTLSAIEAADVENAGTEPRPYTGVQYVQIPEFADLGTAVSQEINAAITGDQTVEEALERGQALAEEVAVDGGYRE